MRQAVRGPAPLDDSVDATMAQGSCIEARAAGACPPRQCMRNPKMFRLIGATRASMALGLDWLPQSPPPRPGSLPYRIGEGDWVVWCLVEVPVGFLS